MMKTNIILIFCIIGLCAAATPKPKPADKSKDLKEKRDAAVSTSAYIYEAPQKSYQIPMQSHQQQQQFNQQQSHQPQQQQQIHQQQQQQQIHQQPQTKTIVEYHQAPQKVAPLELHQQKQPAAVVEVETQHQYYEPASKYAASSGYQASAENYIQPFKGYSDFDFSYPELEAFNQMQIVHYNQDLNKINTAVVGIPGIKAQSYSPSFSSYEAAGYQPSYSFASPSPAYSFPSHTYAIPQQQQHEAYFASYAPSASIPSGPSDNAYYGFSQSPSSIFVPQTVSISPKPAKIPDYASGLKGLGHYSSVSSIASPSHLQSNYIKQQYEAPTYIQYTQTERPFKASAYLGSGSVGQDSYNVQTISHRPIEQYLPPSKTYLPAKEQQHYVPEQSPVEYHIEYIQAPAKSHVPAVANHYLPAKSQAQEQPKSSYLPPPKATYLPPPKATYLPAKQNYSPPKNSYLPPSQPTASSSSYLPPNNPYQSSYHASSHSAPTQYLSTHHSAPAQYSLSPLSQAQYAQYYQQQDSAEASEYQQQSASAGHK